jgi:hypothetical protein
VVHRYLATRAPRPAAKLDELGRQVKALIESRQTDVITKDDLQVLGDIEREEAARTGVEEFKFPTNQEILAAIRRRRMMVSGAEFTTA